jgi:hypothetical protein
MGHSVGRMGVPLPVENLKEAQGYRPMFWRL